MDAPPPLLPLLSSVWSQRQLSPEEFACVKLEGIWWGMGYAVIDSCPPDADSELIRLCHQGEIGEWSPYGWMTVSPIYRL